MPSRGLCGRSAAARWSSASVAIRNLQCRGWCVCRHSPRRCVPRDVVSPATQCTQAHPTAIAIGGIDVAEEMFVHRDLTAGQQWLTLKPCKLFFEFLNIGELSIHRGKPHVGDLVDLLESSQCD